MFVQSGKIMQNSDKPDLVIVGDVAYNTDITKFGEKTSIGGSAYFASVGASIYSKKVGVVARAGTDFDKSGFLKRYINIDGLAVVENEKTARYAFYHHSNGSRDFIKSERGAASIVDTTIFPRKYLKAKYIHLATSPPTHQLEWVRFLRSRIPSSTVVSADTFEVFARESPGLTIEVLNLVDLIFMNEEENAILLEFGEGRFKSPMVLKRGARGATYIDTGNRIDVHAPRVRVVETSGAGEILAGVFLALKSQGRSIADSLRKGVELASMSVTEYGVEHLRKYQDKSNSK
jgi:sugar/nucleoside kinase (ribokinase family)